MQITKVSKIVVMVRNNYLGGNQCAFHTNAVVDTRQEFIPYHNLREGKPILRTGPAHTGSKIQYKRSTNAQSCLHVKFKPGWRGYKSPEGRYSSSQSNKRHLAGFC